MMQISILGCGWLGFPLAQTLIGQGHQIKGSTTSDAKIQRLIDNGINAFKLQIEDASSENPDFTAFLDASDALILNIPPKSRDPQQLPFSQKVAKMIPLINQSSIRKVIFISSTSVYADTTPIAGPDSLQYSDLPAAIELLKSEEMLLREPDFDTIVVRFGGLIGPGRHPVIQLSGRTNIANPDAPVNLIELGDCIRSIIFLLDNYTGNGIFDAVFPMHPSRQMYYTQKATAERLPLPLFAGDSKGKIVTPAKLLELGFDFNYPI